MDGGGEISVSGTVRRLPTMVSVAQTGRGTDPAVENWHPAALAQTALFCVPWVCA